MGAVVTKAAKSGASRNGGTLHRDAITAIDKVAVPAAPTLADVTTGGSLLANTTYNVAIAAAVRWGPTAAGASTAQATAADASNTHVIRVTIAQVTGATHYDIFLSTDAQPLWVARVTEAQRAAAGTIVTAVGTVGSGGPNGAGTVDVRVTGTGAARNANPFIVNNAYLPDGSSITPVNCAGYTKARVLAKLAVTDLRSLPTLGLAFFGANQVSSADWMFLSRQTVSLLTAVGEPLEQEFTLTIDGETGLVVLIDVITGQGAACSIWVELS